MDYFFILSLIFWIVFLLLFLYTLSAKIKYKTEEKISCGFVFFFFCGLIIYMVFIDDRDILFECRKDTQQCTYIHSTIANTKMRQVKTYDISSVTGVRVDEKSRIGKYKKVLRYKIRFLTHTASFEMPKSFISKQEAEYEANKIIKFLSSDKQVYRYKVIHTDDYNTSFYVFIFSMLGLNLIPFGIYHLVQKIRKRKRKN